MDKQIQTSPIKRFKWLIIAGILISIMGYLIHVNNQIIRQQQAVETQIGQVQTVIQRRADLIPNLVNAVKGQQSQEKKVIQAITDARTQYYNANKQYQKANTNADKVSSLNDQSKALNVLVGSIQEAYPKLSSSQNMQNLMTELEGSENRISVERHRYNNAVQTYNNYIMVFPNSMIANLTHHQTMHYFKGNDKANVIPNVKF